MYLRGNSGLSQRPGPPTKYSDCCCTVSPHRAQVKSSQALLASPPAASGSDEAWLALEIDADACTAAPGGAGPGEIRAVTARGELGSS